MIQSLGCSESNWIVSGIELNRITFFFGESPIANLGHCICHTLVPVSGWLLHVVGLYVIQQGDHLSDRCGTVGEFGNCQENVWGFTKNLGKSQKCQENRVSLN